MKTTLKVLATVGLVLFSTSASFVGVQSSANAQNWCEKIGLCIPKPQPITIRGSRPDYGVPELTILLQLAVGHLLERYLLGFKITHHRFICKELTRERYV